MDKEEKQRFAQELQVAFDSITSRLDQLQSQVQHLYDVQNFTLNLIPALTRLPTHGLVDGLNTIKAATTDPIVEQMIDGAIASITDPVDEQGTPPLQLRLVHSSTESDQPKSDPEPSS